MSLHKKNVFTKRKFVNVIKAVAIRSLKCFDYTKKPYLNESNLPGNTLMSFYGDGNFTVITYDYAKFKRILKNTDYNYQYTYAVQCMAHEMRHYYQHRQMTANNPIENKKTLEDWKENRVIKTRGMEKTKEYKYWFCAAELDASLFSYIFTLNNVNRANLAPIINKEHFNALKKLYKQYGGKKTRLYFPKKVKKLVSQ